MLDDQNISVSLLGCLRFRDCARCNLIAIEGSLLIQARAIGLERWKYRDLIEFRVLYYLLDVSGANIFFFFFFVNVSK